MLEIRIIAASLVNLQETALAFNKINSKEHPLITLDSYLRSVKVNDATKYLLSLSLKNKISNEALEHFSCTFFIYGDLEFFEWRFKPIFDFLLFATKEQGVMSAICSGNLKQWKESVICLCQREPRFLGNQLMHHFELMGLGDIWSDYRKININDDFTLELKT